MLPEFLKVAKKNLKCKNCQTQMSRENLYICDICFGLHHNDNIFYCYDCLTVLIEDPVDHEDYSLCEEHFDCLSSFQHRFDDSMDYKKLRCDKCYLPIGEYCRVKGKPWICKCCNERIK